MSLPNILKFNAVTTLPFAGLLLIFNQFLTQFLGDISSTAIILLALDLVIFSFFAWWVSKAPKKRFVGIINALDILWLSLTSFIIIFDPLHISFIAKIVMSLINIVVVFNIFYQLSVIYIMK